MKQCEAIERLQKARTRIEQAEELLKQWDIMPALNLLTDVALRLDTIEKAIEGGMEP